MKISNTKFIGSIGRLQPRKGHKTLIEAMPYILRGFPDAQLRIASGDPDGYSAELKDLIHSLDLEGKVILEGFVEDIPKFLSELDVFALASTDEGLGLVLIEAMAAGLPMVVSRIPPFKEIASGVAILQRPVNPERFAMWIMLLLWKPKIAEAMGAQGRLRVQTLFSPKTMADKTLEVYRRITVEDQKIPT